MKDNTDYKKQKKPILYILASLGFVILLASYLTYDRRIFNPIIFDETRAELRVRRILSTDMPIQRGFPLFFGIGSQVTGPLTIEEIESKAMVRISSCENCPQVPFGHSNESWEEFKSPLKEGGEIYFYVTDTHSWEHLAGRSMYIITSFNS